MDTNSKTPLLFDPAKRVGHVAAIVARNNVVEKRQKAVKELGRAVKMLTTDPRLLSIAGDWRPTNLYAVNEGDAFIQTTNSLGKDSEGKPLANMKLFERATKVIHAFESVNPMLHRQRRASQADVVFAACALIKAKTLPVHAGALGIKDTNKILSALRPLGCVSADPPSMRMTVSQELYDKIDSDLKDAYVEALHASAKTIGAKYASDRQERKVFSQDIGKVS